MSQVAARDSVYYLAYLASALQGRERVDDDFPTNPDFTRATIQTDVGRALNHFSTLLSRGRITGTINEEERVVAVTANLFNDAGYNVWIVSSPATRPVSSARASPSSSSSSGVGKDGLPCASSSGAVHSSNHISESDVSAPTDTPHPDVGPEPSRQEELIPPTTSPWENNVILGRNSVDATGRVYQQTLSSENAKSLEKILALDAAALKALSFPQYTWRCCEGPLQKSRLTRTPQPQRRPLSTRKHFL
ncbi:hypothetical protein C8R44DRAFT_62653 [Mycena epipterygia]|nr:hypothetical protein C8R44DRAFT_62653 [Mycena epipterygia]